MNATLRNTANPTMLKAGYKANVIPSTPTATVDCRVLPGSEDTFRDEVARIVGDDVEIDWTWHPPLEFPFEGDLVEAMKAALQAEDPDGTAVPYMLSGGTDNKAFARLGIAGYGFAPAATARRPGLLRAVPRRRRAGAGRRAAVRHPGAGPAAADLLTTGSTPTDQLTSRAHLPTVRSGPDPR